MKRIMIGLALLVASTASAQTFDLGADLLYEPLLGSRTIHNARAVALGGAVTASAQDGSALWYNPAALARIPRLEISGDLIHNRLKGTTDPLTLPPAPGYLQPAITSTEKDARHTRLGSAYLVLPVPTYRGALTVAAGVTVSNSLDRVLAARLNFGSGVAVDTLEDKTDTLITEDIHDKLFDDDAAGVIHAWQAGFGVDVSPRVSLGFAGVYFEGEQDFTAATTLFADRREQIGTSDTTFPIRWDQVTTSNERISGWGVHAGMLYRPRNNIAIGAVIRSPVQFTIDLDQLYTEQRDGVEVYDDMVATTRTLQVPLSMTFGGAALYGNFLLAGDISYADWSQSEYKDSPVLTQYNSQLAAAYREQFSIGGGIEWVIPSSATQLRAGIRWAQLPYHEDLVVDEHLTYSAGIGFLVDQVMAVDISASREKARGGNPKFGFDEKYATTRIVLTMGYRL